MTRRVFAIAGLLLCAAGFAMTARGGASDVPYYDSADFTPKWRATPKRTLSFALTSQTGTRVTGADVSGRPHVASFVFTRCTTVCPALVRQLKRVQSDSGIEIVSYSVTPDVDTPAPWPRSASAKGSTPPAGGC